MESTLQSQILDLLIVTDIHHSLNNISKLKDWASKEILKGSFKNLKGIIACGDLVNAIPGISCTETDEAQLLEVLSALREVHENVWFIPGNHDPIALFTDIDDFSSSRNLAKFDELATNFHCKRVELAPGLVLAGLGGSVDSTLFEAPETVFWKGFPYTEEQLKERLNLLLNPWYSKTEADESSKTDFILLVTHSGPAYISTTDIFHEENPQKMAHIQSGSVMMTSYIKKLSEKLRPSLPYPFLAHVHGHSHTGLGLSSQVPGHPTINPGALKNGKFVHISFQSQEPEATVWKLKKVQFITL